jgi:alanyl-tRNA synthetase
VLEVVSMKDKNAVVLDVSTFATPKWAARSATAGQIILGANTFPISATTKVGNTWLHFLEGEETPAVGSPCASSSMPASSRHRAPPHRHAHPALGVA